MVDGEIFRPQTSEEKKDFKDIMDTTEQPDEVFMKKLKVRQNKATAQHLPFCYRCAKLDYEQATELTRGEFSNMLGEEAIKRQLKVVNSFEYEKYAGAENFKFGKIVNGEYEPDKIRVPAKQRQIINGLAMEHQYGWIYNLVCVNRGCGHAIDITYEDEEMFLDYMKVDKIKKQELLKYNPLVQKQK